MVMITSGSCGWSGNTRVITEDGTKLIKSTRAYFQNKYSRQVMANMLTVYLRSRKAEKAFGQTPRGFSASLRLRFPADRMMSAKDHEFRNINTRKYTTSIGRARAVSIRRTIRLCISVTAARRWHKKRNKL